MRVGRTSIGNRILSMVLVLCMVIGMIPGTVFADTTGNPAQEGTNADKILAYAQTKLDANWNKTGLFTWDKEQKTDGWRYFNGLMLEAFLMNGLKAENSSFITFAQNYYDYYIADTDSTTYDDVVVNMGDYKNAEKELDSVPPARVLAQLVGTNVLQGDKYAHAVEVIYKNTVGQAKVEVSEGVFAGGNFIHKESNEDWANWQIGLDGIYMAQPFLMEVAKAINEGRLSISGVTASGIADDVYTRLNWISNNMTFIVDGVTMYHHGWGPGADYKNGNGVAWARGVGWYAAGLVDCIALMEEIGYNAEKVNTLKSHLKTLFDGMMAFQQESGLWYNVVAKEGSSGTGTGIASGNFLETSGTGLMAYAMMLAYTRDWVGSDYGTAAKNAFDGIVKDYYKNGQITGIVLKSGVFGLDKANSYNTVTDPATQPDEAKGVGAIIMAASMYDDVVSKLDGGDSYAETFQIGAANVTALDVTDGVVDTSDLKVTVIGSKGTLRTVAGSELTAAVSGSKVNLTYAGNVVATVNANLISTEPTTVSDKGTVTVAGSVVAPTGGVASDTNTVEVKGEASGGDTSSDKIAYKLYTGNVAGIAGKSFVIVDYASQSVALKNSKQNKSYGLSQTVSIANNKFTLTATEAADVEWAFAASGTNFHITNNGFSLRSNQNDHIIRAENSGDVVTVTLVDQKFAFDFTKGYLYPDESGSWKHDNGSDSHYVLLFERDTSSPTTEDKKYTITLSTSEVGQTLNKDAEKTLDYALTVSVDGGTATAATTNDMVWASDSTAVTVDASGKITGVTAGETANITATIASGKVVTVDGQAVTLTEDLQIVIPVAVDGGGTSYDVTLSAESVSVDKDGTVTIVPAVTAAEDYTGEKNAVYTYTSNDTGVATVVDGVVTGVAKGSTTITVTLNTLGGNAVSGASVNVPVTVNAQEHVHSYTTSVTAPTCTQKGYTTHTCTCGDSYKDTYTDAAGHNWASGVQTQAPTCVAAGTTTHTCSVCGAKKYEAIDATGEHTYENGACSVCGAEEPTGPVQPESFVGVTTSSGGDSNQYKDATMTDIVDGAVVVLSKGNTVTAALADTAKSVTVTWEDAGNSYYTLTTNDTVTWTLTASGNYFYIHNGDNYLSASSSNNNLAIVSKANESSSKQALFTISANGSVFSIAAQEGSKDGNKYLQVGSSGSSAAFKSTAQSVAIRVQKVNTTTSYYAISPLTVACEVGDDISQSILEQIVLWSATNTSGAGAAQVTENKPTITLDGLDTASAGKKTVRVLVNGTEIGTVTVNVEAGCAHANTEAIGEPKDATCTEDGITAGEKCSDCGAVITAQETITKLGHDYDDGVVTTQPGCTTLGVKTYTCWNDSSHTYTVDVAAAGHTLTPTAAKEATCTEPGNSAYWHCSVCDKYFSTAAAAGDDEIPKDSWVIAALEHEYENGVCTRCEQVDPDYPVINSITGAGNAATVEAGKTLQLTANITNQGSFTLSWSSGNENIATVDAATGVVTGVAEGTATITATLTPPTATFGLNSDGTVTATFEVTVTAAQPEQPGEWDGETYERVTTLSNGLRVVFAWGDANVFHYNESTHITARYAGNPELVAGTTDQYNIGSDTEKGYSPYLYTLKANSTNTAYAIYAGDDYFIAHADDGKISWSNEGNPVYFTVEDAEDYFNFSYTIAGDDTVRYLTSSSSGFSKKDNKLEHLAYLYTPYMEASTEPVYTVEVNDFALVRGQVADLPAITVQKDGETITEGYTVTWSSNTTSVATVEGSTVNAVAAGTSVLTATVNVDGKAVASKEVTVTVQVPTVTVTGKDKLIPGETATYTAEVMLNGEPLTEGYTVKWYVDSVLQESNVSNGVLTLTGGENGKSADIYATIEGVNGSATVFSSEHKTVTFEDAAEKTLTSITLAPTTMTVGRGGTLDLSQLVITAHYSDDTTETLNQNSDEIIINTNAVNLNQPGTYTVVVTYHDKTANLTVQVTDLPDSIENWTHVYDPVNAGLYFRMTTMADLTTHGAKGFLIGGKQNYGFRMASILGNKFSEVDVEGTDETPDAQDRYSLTPSTSGAAMPVLWQFVAVDGGYHIKGTGPAGNTYYVAVNEGNTAPILTLNENEAKVWTIEEDTHKNHPEGFVIYYSGEVNGKAYEYNLRVVSGNVIVNDRPADEVKEDDAIYLYSPEVIEGDQDLWIGVTGTTQHEIKQGTAFTTEDVLAGLHLWQNTTNSVTGATELPVNDSRVTTSWEGTPLNTALPGEYTLDVMVDGVVVVVVVVVAGETDIHGSVESHDFTSEGDTDPEKFFSFSNSTTTNSDYTTSYDVDGDGDKESLTRFMKVNSKTTISFTTDSTGTMTLVMDDKDKDNVIKLTYPDGTSKEITVPSDGVVSEQLTQVGEHVITRVDGESHLFYVAFESDAKDGAVLDSIPRLFLAGSQGLYPTFEAATKLTVRHGGEIVSSGYTVEWSILDPTIATVDADGTITAKKHGVTTLTATVTIGEVEYTATTVVTVRAPGLTTTEELDLVLNTNQATGTIQSTVVVEGVNVDQSIFVVTYKSSDTSVATVDEKTGVVTAVGAGTAIITAKLVQSNDHDLTGIQSARLVDTTIVNVDPVEIVFAQLDSYSYTILQGSSKKDLIELLYSQIKTDDESGITHDEGVTIRLRYNTGEENIVEYTAESTNITIDVDTVELNTPGIYYALLTYTDTKYPGLTFTDTLWIHVLADGSFKADAIALEETEISYTLETDEIDFNEEYVLVYGNTAVKNLVSLDDSAAAGSAQVTISEDGKTLTISEADAQFAAWLFDSRQGDLDDPYTLNMSNNTCYLGYNRSAGNDYPVHRSVHTVQLDPVSEDLGLYVVVLGTWREQTYWLALEDGRWVASTTPQALTLYKRNVTLTDVPFEYNLLDNDNNKITKDTKISIPQGFVYDSVLTQVLYGNSTNALDPSEYVVSWSSSDETVATVDQNGRVTALKAGNAVITATLYFVKGYEVICNTHNTDYVDRQVNVTVEAATPTPVLTPSSISIGVGSMPDFSKIKVRMTYGTGTDWDYDVAFDDITFDIVDTIGTPDDSSVLTTPGLQTTEIDGVTYINGFYNQIPGTYTMPVEYAGQTFDLQIIVDEDPYTGLNQTTTYPGYPDAGAVRLDKTAEGVVNFNATGVTKLELALAGVSTRSDVDVILVVDVSNSMGWSMDWFEGLSESQVASATDSVKIPDNGAAGIDKLDIAMQAADEFASILLADRSKHNSVSMVTFAGSDRDHGGSSSYVDSVRMPMLGVLQYADAAKVFANTRFTTLAEDGTGAEYVLQIGGHQSTINTKDGTKTYGETQVSGNNRGNTNYDYAFGKTLEAINALKDKYERDIDNNPKGMTYEESGRQIHVVFMTDGAPSHYNGRRGAGNANDQLWNDTAHDYTTLSNLSEANWLSYISTHNELATQVAANSYAMYNIGFDLNHGGFGDYAWNQQQMERVLAGLVKNDITTTTLAENEAQLKEFYSSLATSLAYAGTNSQVTDVVGENFSLFTGADMYSEDIINNELMTNEILAEMKNRTFDITVNSYRLVVQTDIGSELSVIRTNGNIETVTVDDSHLGLRVNEDPQVLEQVLFEYHADGTMRAFSNIKGEDVNILTEENGVRTIDASLFTYTATIDSMNIDGVAVEHANEETFKWKIGTITDREVTLEYYAYLDGSLDNPLEANPGTYSTNEYAYAEYVDVNGMYVQRYFGVPQMAWGAAQVTARFYLVNAQGQLVNRAGVTFTNRANRILLNERAYYQGELNSTGILVAATEALNRAGLAGKATLYDEGMSVNVIPASATDGQINWTVTNGLANIENLKIHSDNSNGRAASVIVDIPVVMTDLGQSTRPLAVHTAVIDYGKPMNIHVFNEREEPALVGYAGPKISDPTDTNTYYYKMEIIGFATYNSNFDLRNYVPKGGYVRSLTTAGGTFSIAKTKQELTTQSGGTVSKEIPTVRFTPSGILKGMQQVFVAVKYQEYKDAEFTQSTDSFYYMYKQLNVIPANVMYYETDGPTITYDAGTSDAITVQNMHKAFTFSGEWTSEGTTGISEQDDYVAGQGIYGFDSSYNNDTGFSNGSAKIASGAGFDKTTAKFTFTGTGFDIISRTGATDGLIRVQIADAKGNLVKTVNVVNKGEQTLYQIPVVSVDELAYGTYTVTIGVYPEVNVPAVPSLNSGNQFVFDAVRIYGTMTGEETFVQAVSTAGGVETELTVTKSTVNAIYAADGEAGTVFTEIRDQLVSAESFGQYGDMTGAMFMDDYYVPVVDENGNAVMKDDGTPEMKKGDVSAANYKTNGANNEVYLAQGNGIAFSYDLADSFKSFDLGMKSVDGNTVNAQIRIVKDGTVYEKTYIINSCTAQFYDLLADCVNGDATIQGAGTIHVVIQNTGTSGILSLTDLKLNGKGTVKVDSETVKAAEHAASSQLNVTSAQFVLDQDQTSVRIAQSVTMKVTAEEKVDRLLIVNEYGDEVWALTGKGTKPLNGEYEWTVILRPTLLGEQTYTVYGFEMGTDADGNEIAVKYGDPKTVTITVTLY